MKLLILITLSMISVNSFAAELGEDKKGECPFLDQSSKREAKHVETSESAPEKTDATKVISK